MFLGTDPEFPIYDDHDRFVPAWKIFPDKEHKLTPFEPQYGLFRDGAMLEINTPPSNCRETLTLMVLKALGEARKLLPPGYRLGSSPTVPVDLNVILQDAPVDAMVFGCEPSWNAYTQAFSTVPLDATEHPFRYAGGHMHIAWKIKAAYCEQCKGPCKATAIAEAPKWVTDPQLVIRYVQLLDRFVGYPLSVWYAKPETFQRRKYYGQAGDFRFQDYGGEWAGIEYRTPGPEIWNDPVPASFAFGAMRAVANSFDVLNGIFDEGMAREIRQAVNEGEADRALLSACYIPFGRATKAQFLNVVAERRPYQSLSVIDLAPGSGNPASIGWEEYIKLL